MNDAVVYGTGKVGEQALPFIAEKYRILYCADQDKSKWGHTWNGHLIISPDQLVDYDCDIIITSTKYGLEIADQLAYMGISRERLYFCRSYFRGAAKRYEIYPVLEEKLAVVEKPLVQYDLFHEQEAETGEKRVLILCSFYSTYTKQLIENMSGRCGNIAFSLLTGAKESAKQIVSDQLKHVYYFETMADLKTILEALPVYDAMQVLWMEWEWAYFYALVRSKTSRLNLNVGGSDFYRADGRTRDFKRKLIACADRIIAQAEGTLRNFQEYYKEETENKMELLPYGIEVMDYIAQNRNRNPEDWKKKYLIPDGRIVVTCGHNAGEAHQHMKLISALERLPERVKEQIVCVFPMAYPQGKDAYIQKVEAALVESELVYRILTEFMDFQSMAEYAILSDIMIHVQTTDQLSSTMLEEMYAGSIVIAGSWLPYRSLHEMGIEFLDVDEVSDVTTVLEEVVTNIESYRKRCAANSEIVWKHSSWDVLAPRWRALWD